MHGAKSGYVDPVSSIFSSPLKTFSLLLSYPAHFPLHYQSVLASLKSDLQETPLAPLSQPVSVCRVTGPPGVARPGQGWCQC